MHTYFRLYPHVNLHQLLAIVNLFSSVLLYNNMGTIERSSVERLSFAVLHRQPIHPIRVVA
jgi:hypothetical protein